MSIPLISEISFLSLRPYDDRLTGPTICTDRLEYWRDDPIGHVVATFPVGPSAWDLRIEFLPDVDHGPLETRLVVPPDPADRKVAIILRVGALAFGTYEVRLTLVDHASGQDAAVVSARFTKVDQAEVPISIPAEGIPIEVEAQTGIPDGSWPVETGVPLPLGAVHNAGELTLFEEGVPIPAALTVHGWWHPNGSIKWLGLAFTARWSAGAPSSYRLRFTPGGPPPAGGIDVRETAREITVDTGAIRFTVSRAFAGIEEPSPAFPGPGPAPRGGPYVVDAGGTIYESWRRPPDTFHVERGAARVRITIAGWYSSAGGQQLCRYHSQIRAFAGLAQVHVAHRTIITFDPANTQLADVGWSIPVGHADMCWTAVDGKATKKATVAADTSTGIHQDRSDRCWLIDDGPRGPRRTLAGKRADGWFSANAQDGVTVVLRDMVERFPKEIELARHGAESWLVLHFWPRHGHKAFTTKSVPPDPSSDALDRHNIHKLWYAHEGPHLNLTFPPSYAAELRALAAGPHVPGENPPNGDNAIDHALTGAAIGVAIGNDFALFSHSASLSDQQRAAFARMFQDDPGALPAPAWSAACGVEGRWASRDLTLFPQAERLLELGLSGFHHAVVDVPRQFGMWIHGGVHDKWLPVLDAPQLHRVWQASHYRNVWMAWSLYLRSGLPALRRWARVTSDRFLDIGTIHYADQAVRAGKHVGDMYHCYAFTPWGGESDVWGHFVDPDAHRLRFLLTGDQFAQEAYDNWWRTLRDLAGIPAGGGNREAVQTLGVLTDCYRHTFDSCALELMWRFANGFFAYFYDSATGHYRTRGVSLNPGDHPVWHRQWLMLYHELTRDPRAKDFVLDWIGEGFGDLSPNAFAAHATGNADWVRSLVPAFLDQCLQVEDDVVDRYHGYGPGTAANYGTYLLQQAPYFLRALRDAGISVLTRGDRPAAYPTIRWSATYPGYWSARIYAVIARGSASFSVSLRPLLGYGGVGGGNVIVSRWDAATSQWVLVVRDTFAGGDAPPAVSLAVANRAADWLCRIDLESSDVRFLAPLTPFPEVAVLRKMFFNGAEWLYASYGVARQDWWLGSLDAQPAELTIEGVRGFYDLPAFVAIEDPVTHVLSGRTVFWYAQNDAGTALPEQQAATVRLQPPGPWHLYTAATGGPVFRLMNGPDRLFLARSRSDLESVLLWLTGVNLS